MSTVKFVREGETLPPLAPAALAPAALAPAALAMQPAMKPALKSALKPAEPKTAPSTALAPAALAMQPATLAPAALAMQSAVQIDSFQSTASKTTFTLSGVHVSVANGLRRIMLSAIKIPTLQVELWSEAKNTSQYNNEILDLRLKCIPVHMMGIRDPESAAMYAAENCTLELDEKNTTNNVQYVTTQHFKIKSADGTKPIIYFAPFEKQFYTTIVRLRPGEQIKLKCKIVLRAVKAEQDQGQIDDSAFNVVSACAYKFTPKAQDHPDVLAAWEKYKQAENINQLTKPEIDRRQADWNLLQGKRVFTPNSFDFIVESVGQYDSALIFRAAISCLKKRFEELIFNPEKKENITIPNCFELQFMEDGHTVGKILEFYLHDAFEAHGLTFCGFIKPHPHDPTCILRVAFETETSPAAVINVLNEVNDIAISVCNDLLTSLNAENNGPLASKNGPPATSQAAEKQTQLDPSHQIMPYKKDTFDKALVAFKKNALYLEKEHKDFMEADANVYADTWTKVMLNMFQSDWINSDENKAKIKKDANAAANQKVKEARMARSAK